MKLTLTPIIRLARRARCAPVRWRRAKVLAMVFCSGLAVADVGFGQDSSAAAGKPALRGYAVFLASNDAENPPDVKPSEGVLNLIGGAARRKPLTVPVVGSARENASKTASPRTSAAASSSVKVADQRAASTSKPTNRYLHDDPWSVAPVMSDDTNGMASPPAPATILQYMYPTSVNSGPASVSVTNRKFFVEP